MLLLPGGFCLVSITAALAHGLSLPRHLEADEELHVMTPSTAAQRRHPGWVGHRGAETRCIVDVQGFPVTDLIDTWIDLGALTSGGARRMTQDDLVVVADEVLNALIASRAAGPNRSRLGLRQRHLDPAVVEPARLMMQERLEQKVRPRGKLVLTAALGLARAGVKSPQETKMRVAFARAGLPEALVNADVHAVDGSGWLAESDLVWRSPLTVAEYQGEHHATRNRRSRDSDRSALLRDEGAHVHEVWAEDLIDPSRWARLVQRVRSSLQRPS